MLEMSDSDGFRNINVALEQGSAVVTVGKFNGIFSLGELYRNVGVKTL